MIEFAIQVNPSEVWLKDEIDGTVYFPLQNGNFDLQNQGMSCYATLIVEGPTLTSTSARNNRPHSQGASSMMSSSTPGSQSK